MLFLSKSISIQLFRFPMKLLLAYVHVEVFAPGRWTLVVTWHISPHTAFVDLTRIVVFCKLPPKIKSLKKQQQSFHSIQKT